MNEETIASLKQRTLEAFPQVPPPNFEEITFHGCEECDGVRNDFKDVAWWMASDKLVYANFGQLPLFTPKAYHYYLPAYIFCSFVQRDHDTVIEYLIYSWSPSSDSSKAFWAQRRAILTDEQKELVRDILRAVIEDESLVYHHKDAERGLRFYSGKEA